MKLRRLLVKLFHVSEKTKTGMNTSIEIYVGGIKEQGRKVKELQQSNHPVENLDIPLLKISNSYVHCKRCLALHLTAFLGREVFADEICDVTVKQQYTDKKPVAYIAYQAPGGNIIYLAKKRHFGIYAEYHERGKNPNNFFTHK